MDTYENYVRLQAKRSANALKTLFCNDYCINPYLLKHRDMTQEAFVRACKNCPLMTVTEVYR